ncbi:integral membrane protein [Clohesyomyces aquaticus]|uniref:Integral membrane protein n=1 Tax=Clohesyomyces aquaticus TaxID=1231657 RepID=A0A1Y2A1H8_9PLEO|nr:integral membrane protein [Clohesyomyces aquaticus]
MARDDSGIGANSTLSYPVALVIMAFLAISLYNVAELTLVIFTTFKRHNGLYFYSLLVAAWGIVPHSLGFLLKFYNINTSKAVYLSLIAVGWPMMVTGQALVLYSRLHLIARGSSACGRWVLAMIIFDAIICHVPTIILLYGANSSNPKPFLGPYSIYEKVQVTVFFLQEVTISGIYVWKTMQLLRSEGNIRGRNSRTVMRHLVWVNIMIIALDVTILAIEYAGFYNIQTTYKSAVYSIKLKLEFAILNRLLDLVQGRIHDSSDGNTHTHSYRAAELGTIKSNIRSKGTALGSNHGKTGRSASDSGLGNSAYAKMDDIGPVLELKDGNVVKTTEVTVERSNRVQASPHSDVESIEGQSMKAAIRRKSASSSEIQIVNNGF